MEYAGRPLSRVESMFRFDDSIFQFFQLIYSNDRLME